MGSKPIYNDDQIVNALQRAKGFVYIAAKLLGCAPSTIHRRKKASKKVRRACRTARGEQLDFAETKLLAAIDAGEAWAICFFLKTQGKARGYIERAELTGKDGGAIHVQPQLTDDQRRAALLRLWDSTAAPGVGAGPGTAHPDGQTAADGFLVAGPGHDHDQGGDDPGPVAESGVA